LGRKPKAGKKTESYQQGAHPTPEPTWFSVGQKWQIAQGQYHGFNNGDTKGIPKTKG
jgi:hypothetical protein